MKKILGLTVAAMMVMGLVGGGTWAYFSDTETSGTNVLTAGTLNLDIDSTDPFTLNFDVPAMQPGSTGSAANWTVLNNGTISGNLTILVNTIANGEGTNPESETEITGDGELGSLAEMALWLDHNQDGAWSSGDQYLASGGSVTAYSSGGPAIPSAAFSTIDSFQGIDWAQTDGIATMTSNAEFDLIIEYNWPNAAPAVDNTAQGDNCTFTMDFTLIQP